MSISQLFTKIDRNSTIKKQGRRLKAVSRPLQGETINSLLIGANFCKYLAN